MVDRNKTEDLKMKEVKTMRKESGITLVTLIITIIILVILAAVSINAAYQSGIINYSVNGTNNYIKGAYTEKKALLNAENVFERAIQKVENTINENIYRGKYTISNFEELKKFRDEVNNGTFLGADNDNTAYLIANINITEEDWIPIGKDENKPFNGIFMGNNFKIYNLNIQAKQNKSGLFGYNNGEIYSLIIESGEIKGSYTDLGAICGFNKGLISNCVNKINISGETTALNYSAVGGIAGGMWYDSKIEKCINYGNINAAQSLVGGIVGCENAGEVKGCVNYGEIYGGDIQAGGIVGYNARAGYINKCLNFGEVYANTKLAGGIVGQSDGDIVQCANYGNIDGEFQIGGIAGYTEGISSKNQVIDSCYNRGIINSNQGVHGGIIGAQGSYASVKNSYNIGEITSVGKYGSIIGRNHSTVTNNILNCFGLEGKSNKLVGQGNSVGVQEISSEEMKATTQIDILNSENTNFIKDTININSGFPILLWQTQNTNLYSY